MQELGTYLTQARELGKAEFLLLQRADWFLLFQAYSPADEPTPFRTLAGGGGGQVGPPTVAPICKRSGANSFSSMITVGRAHNNDLRLEDNSVSKFHAYFSEQEDALYLVDAKSSNGTFVGDEQLTPNSREQLESGSLIRFGDLTATLLDAPSFFTFLQTLS